MIRRSREELIAFLCLILAIRRDMVGHGFEETAAAYDTGTDSAALTVADADERITAIRAELAALGAGPSDLAAFDRIVDHERHADPGAATAPDDPIAWFRTLIDAMRLQKPDEGLAGTIRARRLGRVLSSLDALADLV